MFTYLQFIKKKLINIKWHKKLFPFLLYHLLPINALGASTRKVKYIRNIQIYTRTFLAGCADILSSVVHANESAMGTAAPSRDEHRIEKKI